MKSLVAPAFFSALVKPSLVLAGFHCVGNNIATDLLCDVIDVLKGNGSVSKIAIIVHQCFFLSDMKIFKI